ncbi:hypothetical protein [Streptomyces sp. NPDC059786]
MYDLVAQIGERKEILTELWAAGEDEFLPPELQEPGTWLLPWGYMEGGGHFLYWLVRPGTAPEEWTVLLNEGRGPYWETHPALCSRLLLETVTGRTTSFYLEISDDLVDAADRYRFRPNTEIFGE